jgi:HK97 family phage major capsid protein
MNTMNLADFRSALQRAGRIKGEAGIIAQKKLILDGYMIVDESGMAVDPESLDIVVTPSTSAPAEVETDMAKEEEETMTEEKITNAVKSALADIVATKGINPTMPRVESPRVYGKLKSFKNTREGVDSAYRFGRWFAAAAGHTKSLEWCKTNGINLVREKAHVEGVNSAGGFLVPEEMDSELVTLREEYGVFRRESRVIPMSSDTRNVNKRTGGLTAYAVGEAAAITKSQQTFGQNKLVAKKIGVLTEISSELNEDSIVNLGDEAADEIAQALAYFEDNAGFNGTGTSAFAGIVGLESVMTDSTYQIADMGSVTTYATVGLAELVAAFRKLPAFAASRNNIKIFCNKSAWHGVFERLAAAAGGNTMQTLSDGIRTPQFLGYPVVWTQAIPVSETGGATFAYIGDLRLASYFGDRRQTAIDFSNTAGDAWENDLIGVRATERIDIINANVGSASQSGALVRLTL